MVSRRHLEQQGRSLAGVLSKDDDWSIVTVLGDIVMYCRNDDLSVTPCLINDGFWESWITAWVINNLSPGMRFLDIGANTGYYSLVAARAGAQVIAFEPNPQYSKMLRESVALDESYDIIVKDFGVSDKAEQLNLNVPKHLQGGASMRILDSHYEPVTIKVNTISVDEALSDSENINTMIKIDVEGFEERVWDGMLNTLENVRPTVILEYTPGMYTENFLNKLESYGDLKWVNHDGFDEPISREQILSQQDWIMLAIKPRK